MGFGLCGYRDLVARLPLKHSARQSEATNEDEKRYRSNCHTDGDLLQKQICIRKLHLRTPITLRIDPRGRYTRALVEPVKT